MTDSNPRSEPPPTKRPTTETVVGATPVDRLLDKLDRLWRDRKNPTGAFQWLQKWIRRLLIFTTIAYTVSLCLILLALEYHGEHNLTLAFFLYAPPLGWLLPLIPLVPLCLLFCHRWTLVYIPCVLILLLGYMDYNWTGGSKPEGPSLKIVVNNIGQKGKTSLTPFIEQEQPDVIALQEAGRERQFAAAYPDRHVVAVGEFTLISKYPILKSGVVREATWLGKPAAAWFEIEINGAPIAIYNIHIPSPRSDLSKLRGRGLALGVIGWAGSYFGEVRDRYQESWNLRVEFADALAEVIENDPRPKLAVGDFNMPNHGRVYHRMTRNLSDAFEESGRGYGFTMPGKTRNPLALFGPWMRLDYVLCGEGLRPADCRVEPNRQSQHRAVVAVIELPASN
jgi:endonuclease/exonuclease/phosphatase (EEP) superfamily protein YafD